MNQTTVRINKVSVRMREGGTAGAKEVAARIAAQLDRRTGVRPPQALESALAGRVAAKLPGLRRK